MARFLVVGAGACAVGMTAALGCRRRRRRAGAIDDTLVQRLAVAKYAVEAGRFDEGLRALDEALIEAKRLVTAQLDDLIGRRGVRPGDLVQGRGRCSC